MSESGAAEPTIPEPISGKRLIHAGVAAFVVTCILLLAFGSVFQPDDIAEPGFPVLEVAEPSPDGTFLMTLDTSDSASWVGFDFGTGRVVGPRDGDLATKRYQFRVPGGAIDLGLVALTEASVPEDATWTEDKRVDGILQNTELDAWYDYSYWTHLLRTKNHVYAVRRNAGEGVAYVQIASYYCEPEGTGCLTLRYRLE